MNAPLGRTFALLGICLIACFSAAQDQAPVAGLNGKLAAIRTQVDADRKKLFVPGASLAIVKGDKIIFMEGLGYRDLGHKKPVTPDTLFAIGSTSKAFTSMLTAMANDEGKLKWSDSPKQYLPYFRMRDPETDSKITISDLLSHRSGLPRTDLIMLAGADMSSEDLIWNVTRAKPTAKLGQKWQYQNIMFVAAGKILEKVYGSPWSALVKDRIFTPLSMMRTNTSVPATVADADHALGYDGSPDFQALPMRSIDQAAPAGAINSSARDMAEWVRFLLRGGKQDDHALVSKANFDELFKPHMTMGGNMKYGYGWMLQDWNGHAVIHHGGNIDGFNAEVSLMPDQDLGFVLLTNVSGSALPGLATETIWKNLVGEPATADHIVAMTNPDQEVGTYRLTQANLDFVVTHEGEKLFVTPSGQPKMELLHLGNRKFKVGAPAPDHVYITFAPDKDDSKKTQAELEQAGMKFVMKQAKPFEAPISVEALMAKAIEALGGEENLRRVKTLSYRFVYDMESQGVKAAGVTAKVAPDQQGDLLIFTAAGRRIGWDYSISNGTRSAEETSFSPVDWKKGVELGDGLVGSLMFQELDWQKRFESVSITGTEKVDGQECFVVEKRPKLGHKVTDYISTTSYLLLKRSSGAGAGQYSEIYKEYKPFDGVQIPVSIYRETAIGGGGPVTITDVKLNQPVDPAMLKLPKA